MKIGKETRKTPSSIRNRWRDLQVRVDELKFGKWLPVKFDSYEELGRALITLHARPRFGRSRVCTCKKGLVLWIALVKPKAVKRRQS